MTKTPKRTQRTKAPKSKQADRIQELTDTLQRVQADFENYKKRVMAERAELLNAAKLAVLTDLLPALDNFDRAAKHLPRRLRDDPWAQGMSYVGTQLEQILDEMAIKKFIPTIGENFDHGRMDAIEAVESDQPAGTVVEVTLPGYEITGRVVRPAAVRVARPRTAQTQGEQAGGAEKPAEGEQTATK